MLKPLKWQIKPVRFWFAVILIGLSMGFADHHSCVLAQQDAHIQKIGILISRKIKPYIESAEGIHAIVEARFKSETVYFYLDRDKNKQKVIAEDITSGRYDLLIGVGPEAAIFLWKDLGDIAIPKIYTMVLDPDKIISDTTTACGISMRIPAAIQVQKIVTELPGLKKIGILYDPKYNQRFFEQARQAGSLQNIEIVPLTVNTMKQISGVLNHSWNKIDALWMIPDQTVISESIIKYIIKQSLYAKIMVIGFNRFFYESGATMAFEFDYRKIGEQTGQLAGQVLTQGECQSQVPVFNVKVNETILKRIGNVSTRDLKERSGTVP